MYTKIAENEIENIMEKARHTFGFAPEDYEIKKIEKNTKNESKTKLQKLQNEYKKVAEKGGRYFEKSEYKRK